MPREERRADGCDISFFEESKFRTVTALMLRESFPREFSRIGVYFQASISEHMAIEIKYAAVLVMVYVDVLLCLAASFILQRQLRTTTSQIP